MLIYPNLQTYSNYSWAIEMALGKISYCHDE